MTLFEGRDIGGSRSLTATVNEDGFLNLVQLHGGPAVTEIMGASVGWSEFNVGVKAEAMPGLVAMLGGAPDDDVLGLLEARYRDGTYVEDAVHPLMDAMTAAGVAYSTFAWVN